MRINGTKKRFAVVTTTVAAVLVGGGLAVAYWTTTGSGTGTAPVGDSEAVTYTVSATDGIDDLYPGAAEVFEVDSNNPTDGTLQVAGVDVAIVSTSAPATCLAAWFSVTDIAGPIDLAAGTDVAGTATISMTNAAVNQDACKNASVNLSFTSS